MTNGPRWTLPPPIRLPWSYRLVSRLWPLFGLMYAWWRGRKEPEWRLGLLQRLGWLTPAVEHRGGLWIHAASVGEVQAVRPLVDLWLRADPPPKLILTCQTPTGLETARQLWADQLPLSLAPFDSAGCVTRWLDKWQPMALVLVERELWPHWMAHCTARGIPVVLVNARLSTASERAMARHKAWFAPALRGLAGVLTVDSETSTRLSRLGTDPARVLEAGNLKFDRSPAAMPSDLPTGLLHRPILIAGSTHAEDEAWVRLAWSEIKSCSPGALLVIAPRHPRRFESVVQEFRQHGFRVAQRSERRGELPPEFEVLVLDTLGELAGWYGLGSVCFVGGTISPVGGHSPLEALAVGRPVCFGPHTDHFLSLYESIEQAKVGHRLSAGAAGAAQLAQLWALAAVPAAELKPDAAVLGFMRTHQGAIKRTASVLHHELDLPGRAQRLAQVATTSRGTVHDVYCPAEVAPDELTVWFEAEQLHSRPVKVPNSDGAAQVEVPDSDGVPPRDAPESNDAPEVSLPSGRAPIRRLPMRSGGEAIIRQYRRGGAMARWLHDRYLICSPHNSRAHQEFELLRQMRAQGLPVPEALAARQHRAGLFYRAQIAVRAIPETKNLAQVLDQQRPCPELWQGIGRAIAALHAAGIDHVDLNVHNVLLNEAGQVWIIDFDRCCRRGPGPWQEANLRRLLRSLRKEMGRRLGFQWYEEDWPSLLAGYRQNVDGAVRNKASLD